MKTSRVFISNAPRVSQSAPVSASEPIELESHFMVRFAVAQGPPQPPPPPPPPPYALHTTHMASYANSTFPFVLLRSMLGCICPVAQAWEHMEQQGVVPREEQYVDFLCGLSTAGELWETARSGKLDEKLLEMSYHARLGCFTLLESACARRCKLRSEIPGTTVFTVPRVGCPTCRTHCSTPHARVGL